MKKLLVYLLRLLKSRKVKIEGMELYSKYKRISFDVFNDEYELFITNSIGGGTKTFADNYCKGKSNVLVLQNLSYRKDYCFILTNNGAKEIRVLKKNDLNRLFELNCIKNITINSLVRWKCGLEVLDLISKSKKPVLYMMHDFYCICPNFNLFENGQFCDFKFCETNRCFKNNKYFFKIFTAECDSHSEWNKKWNDFFKSVTEIRCFSNSSKEIFMRNFPLINVKKISVVPHSMDYCKLTSIKIKNEVLTIGIVGAIITEQKGCAVVKEFLKLMKNKSVNIFVVGTLKKSYCIKGKNIFYTGKYEPNSLGHILEKNGINAVLFSSICPETFSFLVSELMFLDIPIVSFNFGAQAEKIRNYKNGVICNSTDPKDIFSALEYAFIKYRGEQ